MILTATYLTEDMLTFALDNPAGTIVLVSGDGDFTRVLSLLRQRNFSTVVIYPPNHSTSLLNYAVRAHDWDQLRGAGGLVDESTDEKKAADITATTFVQTIKPSVPPKKFQRASWWVRLQLWLNTYR